MTGLAHYLRQLIRDAGPIPLAAYMEIALGHPTLGYYRRKDPLGAAGDFITAPEISQMFGELIGLWCVQRWRDMGAPPAFALCELGPGRGTLMADALRAAKLAPDFLRAMQIHLLEINENLRRQQKAAIPFEVVWHESLAGLPPLPVIFVANEFFDALPIRQFQKRGDAWHERLVETDPDTDKFRFTVSPVPAAEVFLLPAAVAAAPPGAVAEICPAAAAIVETLAAHIHRHGGAGLIIDYGPSKSAAGDSFQAMRGHGFCCPFAAPGETDLTAHVDFQRLGAVARQAGCEVDGPTGQGQFLLQLGIAARAQRLNANADPDQQAAIQAAYDRLTNPAQMGNLFKAMALRHPDLTVAPGFEW